MKIKIDRSTGIASIFCFVMSILFFITALHDDYWTAYFTNKQSIGMMQSVDNLVAKLGYAPIGVFCSIFCLFLAIMVIVVHNRDIRENKPEV